MRKLNVLLAALALILGVSSQAGAATVSIDGGSLSLSIGALPPVSISANGGSVFVSSGDGSFTLPASVFGPVTIPLNRSLFTGVPQISGLTLGGFANGSQTFSGAAGTGTGGLQGSSIVNVLQLLNLSIPLNVVGKPGASVMAGAGAILITVVGQGWTTGTAAVTGVTTEPPPTMMGSDSRTPGHSGNMTLVSGFQAITNVAGTLPGFAVMNLSFVPEPGELMLLASGLVTLGALGRRRLRRR